MQNQDGHVKTVCAARQDANRLSESGDAGERGAAAAGCAPGDANAAPGMDWKESWEEPAMACWASRRAMTALVPERDMLLCFCRFFWCEGRKDVSRF